MFFSKSFFKFTFHVHINKELGVLSVLSVVVFFTYRYPYPFDPALFIEQTIFTAQWHHFYQARGCICVDVLLDSFVPLVHLSVFEPVPFCLTNCGFIIPDKW